MQKIRLDKLLSEVGFCSKKRAGEFLQTNKVLIDEIKVSEPGKKVDMEKNHVTVNGKVVTGIEEKVYYLLNKPKGVISTVSDEHGRVTVVSLINDTKRIFPVGRLDENTSGLIILTNDGDFSNRLTHPTFHIPKTYQLTIRGFVPKPALEKLKNGVKLEEATTQPAIVNLINKENQKTILEMVIFEGKNRQIRRMCGKLKLELLDLKRVAIGRVRDNNLKIGGYRVLTAEEVTMLIGAD